MTDGGFSMVEFSDDDRLENLVRFIGIGIRRAREDGADVADVLCAVGWALGESMAETTAGNDPSRMLDLIKSTSGRAFILKRHTMRHG